MLTAIEIENFKGISEPVRIELRPITLLFGPNSAGKSTVLHALQYAREVLMRGNVDAGKTLSGGNLLDLGGFENFVHGRDPNSKIRIRIDFKNDGGGFPKDYLYGGFIEGERAREDLYDNLHSGVEFEFEDAWVEIHVSMSHGGRALVSRYEVGADGRSIARIECDFDGAPMRIKEIDAFHPLLTYDGRAGTVIDEFDQLERLLRPMPDGDGGWLNSADWENSSAECDTYTRSALPSWDSQLKILAPTVAEHIERFHANFPDHGYNISDQVRMDFDEIVDDPTDESAFGNWLEGRVEQHAEEHAERAIDNWNEEFQRRLSLVIVGIGQLAISKLEPMTYLGPLREVPDRNFSASRFPDESRWANGLAAWDLLFRSEKDFINEASHWMERLGTGFGLQMEEFKEIGTDTMFWSVLTRSDGVFDEDEVMSYLQSSFDAHPTKRQRLLLTDLATQLGVRPMDVGVGISQVLPVVVASLAKRDDSARNLTMIEQPELHVHPAIQVELGDLFANRTSESGRVLLVETHSEHLMLRLCRRIEETSSGELPPDTQGLSPEQVAVYFIENRDGLVRADRINIDETGEFVDRWPHGFFEERSKELF